MRLFLFKADVKRIRKYSESEYVKALMRFHYRDIDRHRAELHRNKRPSFQNKTSTVRNVKSNSKKGTPSAPESSNMNATNITKIAEDIQEKMVQFNTMMLKLQEMSNEKYKCLFSESYANQGATNKQNLSNRKRKERKRNARLEANKKHRKPLKSYHDHRVNQPTG